MEIKTYRTLELLGHRFDLSNEEYDSFMRAMREVLSREGYAATSAPKLMDKKKKTINDPDIIKDKVEQMEPPKRKKQSSPMLHKKDVIKYARMIKNGEPEEAVKNKMIKDHFCGQSSIKYYYKRALEESKDVTAEATIAKETYVTKVEDPYSDRQKINALYAQNKTKLPLDICKEMTTWGQDLEDSEIVFRGNLLKGSHDHKDLIAAYHYAQGARDK